MCSSKLSNTGKKLYRLSRSAIGGQSRVSRLNKSATLGQLHQIYWNHIQPHGIWWKNWKIKNFEYLTSILTEQKEMENENSSDKTMT